jgi:hypothetical protein
MCVCLLLHDRTYYKAVCGGRGTVEGTCAMKYDELRCVCVCITAGPIMNLCAGGRGTVKDMCYEVRRAEACVDE